MEATARLIAFAALDPTTEVECASLLQCTTALLDVVGCRPSGLGRHMRRRAFITLLGSAAAAWPLVARAQQGGPLRRLGILLPASANNPAFQSWVRAFLDGLTALGWIVGKTVQTDTRWATTDAANIHKHAAELVALGPDVILAHGASTVGPLEQLTQSIPIVFAVVSDPVAAGYVESLSHPGGNVTGFMVSEYNLGGKWLELLKEVAPNVRRVAVLRDPSNPTGVGQFGVLQGAAPSLYVEVVPLNVRAAADIDRAVTDFAKSSNGGLILTPSGFAQLHRDLIISVASREKLPAVYFQQAFAAGGGLLSYGPSFADQYHRAAGYIDRILKGEKPAALPVQAPTKYELVINLKTARALGLEVPASLLARADEVIE
ncbi:MAG: ABC transporter substrate-binding protein [Xanthobacteraceae bacterium]